MQLTVQGKQMEVGDALRTHVASKLEEINAKYFNHATDTTVIFAKEGHGRGMIRTHVSIRVGKNIMIVADSEAQEPYPSFDIAAEKVAKQLRRYKRRLRDHHEAMDKTPETEMQKAQAYVLAAEAEAANDDVDEAALSGADPVIIAEMTTDIPTLSVSDAVMRMDLGGQNAMMFRNAKHGGLNMVYRRPDGNVGWMDPAQGEK